MYSVKIFIKILFAILCSRFIRNSELACEIFFPYDFLPSGAMQPICDSTRWKKRFQKSLLATAFTVHNYYREDFWDIDVWEIVAAAAFRRRVLCVAVGCSVLQCVAVVAACCWNCCSCCLEAPWYTYATCMRWIARTLHHAATPCNTLQHAATHCNTLQHAATHWNTLQHTATHCSPLLAFTFRRRAIHLQHACMHALNCTCPATPCNTLQHTATHF